MNVLFISDYYPPHIKGGAEVSTSLLVSWLASEHQVSVVCSRLAPAPWEYEGVRVYPELRFASVGSGHRSLGQALAYAIGIVVRPTISAVKVLRLVHRLKPDVVQVIPSGYQFIPLILAIRFLARKPVAVDCRDYSIVCPTYLGSKVFDDTHSTHHGYRCLKGYKPGNLMLSLLARPFAVYESCVFNMYKSLLRSSSKRSRKLRLVAISKYVRHQLLLSRFAPHAVKVIPNIAPVAVAAPGDARAKTAIFVFAARIEAEKGIWDIVSAAELLNAKGHKFIVQIVGAGIADAELAQYIDKHRITYIKMVGKITPAQVVKLYSKALAVLAPTRGPEPFGRFIQEAATAGVPVIATRAGGIPEGIEDGVTGFLVGVGDVDQLAAKMELLIKHPEKKRAMFPAIATSLKRFSAEKIGNERLRFYRSLTK